MTTAARVVVEEGMILIAAAVGQRRRSGRARRRVAVVVEELLGVHATPHLGYDTDQYGHDQAEQDARDDYDGQAES